MATTKRGIRYPYGEDYDLDADVPEDLKKMAESTDEAIDDVEKSLEEKLGTYANTYDRTETYSIGSIVVYDKKIYECLEETTGEFDTTKWQEVTVKELIDKVEEITTEIVSEVEEEIKPSIEEVKQEIVDIEEEQATQNESIEENYKEITKLQEDVADAEKNQLTNTPTPATSHYLQDSADSRFRKFIPIGRTTQESTTGANILPFKARTNTATGATYICDDKGQVTIKGTASLYPGNTDYSEKISLEAGTYKVKVIGNATGVTFKYSGVYSYSETIYLDNNKEATITIAEATSNFAISNGITKDTTYNCDYYITLAKGTTATTERYTGGEPAPNPIYPFPIKNTGDNGSVNEKLQNKNLLASENINVKVAGVTYKSQEDGTILANGEKYGGAYANFTNNIVTLENDSYSSKIFLLDGTIKKDGVHQRPSCYLVNTEDSTKTYYIGEIGNPGISKTIPAGTYFIRIAVWSDNIVFTNAKIGLMLVKGSTIPDEFVLHSEQNISFPLAQGQKFYEGSYPDDDEKVHHKMGEIDLSTLTYTQYATNKYRSNIINNIKIPATQSTVPNMFAEKYRPRMQNGTFENGEIGITQNGEIILCDTTGTPSGIIQYELSEEQTEDFTEEQKTAWEEWKKARTYKNVTHISSEDETPANVEIEYVQDTKTYIDNQIEPLKSAIISLGGNV